MLFRQAWKSKTPCASRVTHPNRHDQRFSILAENCQSGQTLFEDPKLELAGAEASCVGFALAAAFFLATRAAGLAAAGEALAGVFFRVVVAAAGALACVLPSVLVLRIEAIN